MEGEEGDEDEDYDDDESVLSEESAEDEVDVRWKRAVANNRTLPGRFERGDTSAQCVCARPRANLTSPTLLRS